MIKFNKVMIEFVDIDESIAGIKVLLDPPMPEESKAEEMEVVNQPCILLATKVLGFLNFLKESEKEGAIQLGEQGSNSSIIH